jgi:hypothetical protein
MKTAIVGLPMVGKTSLFTILTGVHESARVGSLEARVGITKVADARVDALARLYQPPKITYATVEYLDFPAVSKEVWWTPWLMYCVVSRATPCRTRRARSIRFAISRTSRSS